jgi:1-acyl-sn-glycerol-3-phosphate acyltransferase
MFRAIYLDTGTNSCMTRALRSAWTWCAVTTLIVLWLPLLGLIRLFDRDPVHYRTGRWFRRLGVAMTKVNPAWQLAMSGARITNPRHPYVVVANHQSMADIPLISHVPWEMKWVGKVELFRLPIVGLMMKLANDIPVDRSDRRSGTKMILRCLTVLENRCSVMFFPEGTRSHDALLGPFNEGAFHIAIRAQVPVLPLVIEGSFDCLPKKSWKFGAPSTILLKILEPVETRGMTVAEVEGLRDRVRGMIAAQLAEWRGVTPEAVDRLSVRGA